MDKLAGKAAAPFNLIQEISFRVNLRDERSILTLANVKIKKKMVMEVKSETNVEQLREKLQAKLQKTLSKGDTWLVKLNLFIFRQYSFFLRAVSKYSMTCII